jgi:undecaprenyl-diphosphatase
LAFDSVLHWGTLVALVLFFWPDLLKYFLAWIRSFSHFNLKTDEEARLAWYLLAGTVPAVVIGYFFADQIENNLRSPFLVSVMLILVGIILYFFDQYGQGLKNINQLSLKNSLVIGVAQALAFFPGVSRSGITIIAGLSQKLKRQQAAYFSFLLSTPVVFGGGLKKILDLTGDQIVGSDILILFFGFLSSAVTGYFCIKYFLKFLQSHSLKVFAYYRVILGIVILVILLFR